jgi:predicted RNA methylase
MPPRRTAPDLQIDLFAARGAALAEPAAPEPPVPAFLDEEDDPPPAEPERAPDLEPPTGDDDRWWWELPPPPGEAWVRRVALEGGGEGWQVELCVDRGPLLVDLPDDVSDEALRIAAGRWLAARGWPPPPLVRLFRHASGEYKGLASHFDMPSTPPPPERDAVEVVAEAIRAGRSLCTRGCYVEGRDGRFSANRVAGGTLAIGTAEEAARAFVERVGAPSAFAEAVWREWVRAAHEAREKVAAGPASPPDIPPAPRARRARHTGADDLAVQGLALASDLHRTANVALSDLAPGGTPEITALGLEIAGLLKGAAREMDALAAGVLDQPARPSDGPPFDHLVVASLDTEVRVGANDAGPTLAVLQGRPVPLAEVLPAFRARDPSGYLALLDLVAELGGAVEVDDTVDALVLGLNRRIASADAEIEHLERMSAEALDLPLEVYRAKRAEERAEADAAKAAEKQRKAEEKATVGKVGWARGSQGEDGVRRLHERQRALLAAVRVEDNRAAFGGAVIPDWENLRLVLEALGGTWVSARGKKTAEGAPRGHFRFEDDVDAAEVVRLAQETGEVLDADRARLVGFFPTSRPLAAELARRLGPIPAGARVLEPSAGKGRLVEAVLEVCPSAAVTAVELLPENVEAFEAFSVALTVIREDFLVVHPSAMPAFDFAIANPPFAKRADVTHLLHLARFLRPGGRCAAIAGAGALYRREKLYAGFRAFLEAHGGTLEAGPEGAFLESGTNVRIALVTFTACADCRDGRCTKVT